MPFALHIFQSEFDKIRDFVLAFPNIETGGDLFGLWTRDGEPVVQLLVGPGAKCRRTNVSFHQDIEYLQNVGTYLNSSFMLCHIGSWHSHHQLSLSRPSAGDRSTVCNNFPRGLQRYIMVIANIVTTTRTGAKSVEIHPFMFTSEGHVLQSGTVQRNPTSSPFMENGYVLGKLGDGAERSRVTSRYEHDSPRGVRSPEKLRRRSPDKTSSENVQPAAKSQRNGYPEKSEASQWYSTSEGEAKLKKISENISAKLQPTGDVKFNRNANSFDLSLEFTHGGYKWLVEFPESYDKEPAKIQRDSSPPTFSANIVETIQKKCVCQRCYAAKVSADMKPQNRETLGSARSKSAVVPERGRNGERFGAKPSSPSIPWHKTAMGKSTLETLQKDIISCFGSYVTSNSGRDASLTFSHERSEWIIEFPENYPEISAKLYKKERGGRKFACCLLEPQNVLQKIKQNCRCRRCVSSQETSRGPRRKSPYSKYSTTATSHSRDGRRPITAKVTARVDSGHVPDNYRKRTSGNGQQWYLSDKGEKLFRRIVTGISAQLLRGGQPEMTRSTHSKDVILKFNHNRLDWIILFPSDYPKSVPETGYHDRLGRYNPVSVKRNTDVLAAIRDSCDCSSCRACSSSRIF